MLALMCAAMLALCVYGARRGFTYWQQLARLLVIGYGVKAFDIIALDYFLVSKSHFFQHYLPETEGCAGYRQFGYNRRQQLRQIAMIPAFCAAAALVFTRLG